ncbi:MAG: lipopolysaccharide biosynthesis protein [Candidatus Methylomirabilota bacterium]|nr:MAG: lipopolysaccharide biosynthesis protein [candidate division NC10 bacterium]
MNNRQQPEILFIVDIPCWAHDYKTIQLQSMLEANYRIIKLRESEVTEVDLDRADLIVVYYWSQFRRMKDLTLSFMRNRYKILIGICSHAEFEGRRREPGLAMLRRFAHGVFCVNKLLYNEFRSLVETPIFYTPNGVDTDFYRPSAGATTAVRPRTARTEHPRHDRLPAKLRARLHFGNCLRLLRQGIARQRPHHAHSLRVGWAGSLSNHGSKQRGFYNLIVPAVYSVRGAQLVTAIREEQWRGPDEMLEFYRSLDVYVCASRNEGTPNPCLEAAACGVPLVTTRVGNMIDLIESKVNGLFVEPTISDIASQITLLRDEPQLRTILRRNILRSIQAWTWKRQAENYRQMFDAMLDN